MFKVTIAKKKPDHPFYKKGAANAYVINGSEGYTLKLTRGKTYTFDVNASGHPFYMTTDSTGGQGSKDSLMGPNEIVTDKGRMTFKVRDDLPNEFYYQCQIHPKMGGKVIISRMNKKNKLLLYYCYL